MFGLWKTNVGNLSRLFFLCGTVLTFVSDIFVILSYNSDILMVYLFITVAKMYLIWSLDNAAHVF